MNYELAKKLKDSGFPQMGDGFALVLHDEKNFEDLEDQTMSVIPWCQYVYNPSKRKDVLYAPTLSELIEACGDNFWSLQLGKVGDAKGKWVALTSRGIYTDIMTHWNTPEEAVANLYLALKR